MRLAKRTGEVVDLVGELHLAYRRAPSGVARCEPLTRLVAPAKPVISVCAEQDARGAPMAPRESCALLIGCVEREPDGSRR